MSKADGQLIAIRFTEKLTSDPSQAGNELAFTVSGYEYNMEPGGVLVPMVYPVRSVAAYPADEYAILLEVEPLKRFVRVSGELTVSYDAAKGGLAGLGGPVTSFTRQFMPVELINKPHPHDMERVEIAGISISAPLIRVYYSDFQVGEENIQITSITAVGVLININDL